MSFVYFLSKFSSEAMLFELFCIGCLCTAWFGWLLTKKRKYGTATKNIPDDVVRAFLVELSGLTEGYKNQLFGENFKFEGATRTIVQTVAGVANAGATAGVSSAELDALRAQLNAAVAKQNELGNGISKLQLEKSDLEAKLAQAGKNAGGGNDKALAEELSHLKAKLAEYEVIEDDLANLKKYQQENKKLKEQLAAMGGTPAAATPEPVAAAPAAPEPVATAPEPAPAAPEPVAAAPAPTPAAPDPIAAAEETIGQVDASKNFEGLVDKIEESLTPAAPSGASVNDPLAAAAPAVDPMAGLPDAAPAAPAGGEKSDADLLSEFERMLNS